MRFLADESCDFSVVCALRTAGPDVLAVAELASGSNDTLVMDFALREARILLTEDKDFGQLVYAHSHQSCGVLLIRYPANLRKALPPAVVALVAQAKTALTHSFVVDQTWTYSNESTSTLVTVAGCTSMRSAMAMG